MTRKICVVTGTRAEYGLLRWLMAGVDAAPDLLLQIIATGMHLSPEFGLTYKEIEANGFVIDRKIEMLLSSDTAVGIAKSMALGLAGFADGLADLRPDCVVLLGDRFEIMAAASAALVARIPIVHLHGGETTEGAFDEAFRHSITKMSYLHCVAAEPYRQRVIQLGEAPERVFLVGGLGIDAIARTKLLSREALECDLGFRFGPKNLLVTFHPATLDAAPAAEQMEEVLAALETLRDTQLIFTKPNADNDGRAFAAAIDAFVARNPNAMARTSLGQLRYFSCLAQVDGVVGNSSSGLLEAPSFGKGTINIGDRQQGRLRAESVIDCAVERAAIGDAIDCLYSAPFQRMLSDVRNPYGEPGASERIVEVLRSFEMPESPKKPFYDLLGPAGKGN
jgi:GDP/UDP-N,N'-diacetylbacillosamine 2-epimerase (hydrolysing)